jgi:folate-dependent phosphoribosylglycinamide formyltransferase PurN
MVSISIAVFASGGGSNFQSLLDHETDASPGRIRLLVSDREDAGALERARRAGVPTAVVPVKGRPLEEVGEETLAVLNEHGIEVILLAGYLRLVPPTVVRAFPRRILNIHPALLPSFVDEEYDTGAILAQWPVPVLEGDTPDTLAARVLAVEHLLYPLAAEHLCRTLLEGKVTSRLSPPGEAVQIAPVFSPEETERQLRAAFSPAS